MLPVEELCKRVVKYSQLGIIHIFKNKEEICRGHHSRPFCCLLSGSALAVFELWRCHCVSRPNPTSLPWGHDVSNLKPAMEKGEEITSQKMVDSKWQLLNVYEPTARDKAVTHQKAHRAPERSVRKYAGGESKTRITESPKHNTCPKEEVTDGVSCANGYRKMPTATLLSVVVDSVTAHKCHLPPDTSS